MAAEGFLLVLFQPQPIFEEEFNAWYDTEHLPERVVLPGFESGRRYVSADGSAPRYLAMYDLTTPEAIESDAYMAISGANFSPWTKRVAGRARTYRAAGRQLPAGRVVSPQAARVLLVRFRGLTAGAGETILAGLNAQFANRPEILQVRVLENHTPAGTDYLGFVEARGPIDTAIDPKAFGAAGETIDLVSSYAPY